MTGLSEDCCAYAPRPMTSNAGATICGTRMYSGLSFVPDICDFRVSLIAAFSEFPPSTPSLTAQPPIDDSNFILNQMVHNQERIREIRTTVRQMSSCALSHRECQLYWNPQWVWATSLD